MPRPAVPCSSHCPLVENLRLMRPLGALSDLTLLDTEMVLAHQLLIIIILLLLLLHRPAPSPHMACDSSELSAQMVLNICECARARVCVSVVCN